MGDRPDVQAHQFERRTLGLGDLTAECGCRVLYHIESALGRGQRLDLSARNRAGLEHHGITCRLVAVAKMPVGRGRADSGKPRGLSQAEAEGTMLLDQLASGL